MAERVFQLTAPQTEKLILHRLEYCRACGDGSPKYRIDIINV